MTATHTTTRPSELIATMRVGFTGGMYPVPADVPPEQRPDWQLSRSAELGCTALQIPETPSDPEIQKALRARAESLDIELEGAARAMFVPLGTPPAPSPRSCASRSRRARPSG